MSCAITHELLDEFLDETLPAEVADEVRRHLETCVACRDELRAHDELRAAAASLPRSVMPERDLWPGIAAHLGAQEVVRTSFGGGSRPVVSAPGGGRSLRWFAAAAAIVVAVAVAYQLGRSQRSTVIVEGPPPASVAAAVAASASPDVELELRQVRDELRDRLELRRDELDESTMEIIDENLELIDHAIERISVALASDPGNARLTRQLVFAYRQQIDLLRRSTEMPLEL